ncbi:hypothetical protein Tco_0323988 [Tanacetum coccineum]
MTKSGGTSDHVNYINLLSACVHGVVGEVEKGEKLVRDMPFEPDLKYLIPTRGRKTCETLWLIVQLDQIPLIVKYQGDKRHSVMVFSLRAYYYSMHRYIDCVKSESDENLTMHQQQPQRNSNEFIFGSLTLVTAQKARVHDKGKLADSYGHQHHDTGVKGVAHPLRGQGAEPLAMGEGRGGAAPRWGLGATTPAGFGAAPQPKWYI